MHGKNWNRQRYCWMQDIIKKSRILSDEKNGLLNALYGLKEYWKEPEKCVKIDERHLVIDPQRESMEFFYDFGKFCEKEKCSVFFRMSGFGRIREDEKKAIAGCKKRLEQFGLPYISKWFLCWMFEIILALY